MFCATIQTVVQNAVKKGGKENIDSGGGEGKKKAIFEIGVVSLQYN